MKLSCIIIDDEPNAHLVLKHHLKHTNKLSCLGNFYNGIDAIAFIKSNPVDLVFLDINMPELSGFDMLQSLSKPPMVIFTTAHSEFAIDGYKFSAIDYLLKPIERRKLLSAIDRAIQRKKLDRYDIGSKTSLESFISIKTDEGFIKVELEDILYTQSYGNYVKIITTDKRYLTPITTSEIEEKLSQENFLRIHKSYIVAIKYVSKISNNVLFIKSLQLPIGNTFKREVLRKLKDRRSSDE